MAEEEMLKQFLKRIRIRQMGCIIMLPTERSREIAHKEIWGY